MQYESIFPVIPKFRNLISLTCGKQNRFSNRIAVFFHNGIIATSMTAGFLPLQPDRGMFSRSCGCPDGSLKFDIVRQIHGIGTNSAVSSPRGGLFAFQANRYQLS
jgi:hypothetical protein